MQNSQTTEFEEKETKRLKLSWNTIHDSIEALAYMVSPYNPNLIIGVSRGGLIPATLLSHKLNVPMAVITASAYEGTRRTLQKPIVIDGWKPEYDSCDVVVVDDIIDSGDTFRSILSITGSLAKFRFATIVNKQCTQFPAFTRFFAQVPKDVWVQFPWEQEES